MKFHEKLGFLMNITETSNSALARHLILDPSYISRLKSGKRLAPKDQDLIHKMGAYFARNAQGDYQYKAISDALGLGLSKEDKPNLTNAINHWLTTDTPSPTFFTPQVSKGKAGSKKPALPKQEAAIFYGVEGKRQAILHSLKIISSLKKPSTLLLFSDEESSWMTGDLEYMKEWNVSMGRIVASGHKIKIVHTISRHLDEMLSAINHWIPLYMSGAIESYHYPKKRDGIFRRTLFIVPGVLAMISSSVGEATSIAANIVLQDPKSVTAYEEEFNQFLDLCQPLMTVYSEKDKVAAIRTLKDFELVDRQTIVKSESLSPVSMPADLFKNLVQEAGYPNYTSYDFNFNQRFIEIIKLPPAKEVLAGKLKMPTAFMMTEKEIFYKPQDFIYHLENIIELLKTKENYFVSLIKENPEERYAVYNKANMGTIVASTSLPPVMLAMKESNLTASFEDFLDTMIDKRSLNMKGKNNVIKEIEAYINEVQSLLNKEEKNVQ